mgnify:CR=1 FL=1
MSKLETNTIDTISGTNTLQVGSSNVATVNVGASGDTVNVGTGATVDSSNNLKFNSFQLFCFQCLLGCDRK